MFSAAVITACLTSAVSGGIYSGPSGTTNAAPDNPIARSAVSTFETSVVEYFPAAGVSPSFTNPETGLSSLGEVNGSGTPGYITLGFDAPITNGLGADFAVFENGFNFGTNPDGVPGLFAEFAYVDVSTNGSDFLRFPSINLNSGPLPGGFGGAFSGFDVTNVHNLAGKHAANWGTPFDLDALSADTLVLNGIVNLDQINYIRLTDIPGDGSYTDSLGNPIYDNYPTSGSGGFDYVGLPTGAIGVLNSVTAVPEPSSLAILGMLTAGFVARHRRRRRHPSETSKAATSNDAAA